MVQDIMRRYTEKYGDELRSYAALPSDPLLRTFKGSPCFQNLGESRQAERAR